MKKISLITIMLAVLFAACSKDKDLQPEKEHPPVAPEEVYEFQNISFFLSPGDANRDTVQYQLDTIYVTNTSNIRQPDAILYPYSAVKDSFELKFDAAFEPLLKNAVYKDSIKVPHTVMMDRLYYNGSREIKVGRISGINVLATPLTNQEVKLSVTPRTRLSVTGTYHRFVSRAGFRAEFKEKHSGKIIMATGRWFSSIATTQSFNKSASLAVTAQEI